MFLTHVTKYRKLDGEHPKELFEGRRYYRLSESYRDKDGKPRNRVVMGLGYLEDFSDAERKELALALDSMLTSGEIILVGTRVHDRAIKLYSSYMKARQDEHQTGKARAESEALKTDVQQHRDQVVRSKVGPMHLKNARTVGAENICMDTARRLGIHGFLLSKGFTRRQADMAVMQIIARAVYPGSELRTARCLQDNSALCELLGVKPEEINKDALYRSARRLWDIHREMEDYLHRRVVSMFDLEEKIYLFDLTNTYFEGRMEGSELCDYGRSKEKRTDCKIVVLAAVVNTDGLLVRTEIFEGNRQDVTTLQHVIGSLSTEMEPRVKKVIVMDAGFCSEDNLAWLRDNNYDYITVMRSKGQTYTAASDVIERVSDNKQQQIRLQKVTVEDCTDSVLLVDSDAKTLKESSMHKKAARRYEDGLDAIIKGIKGKGTKKRDPLQRRIGRLNQKYHGMSRAYEINVEYDDKDRAVSMSYTRKEQYLEERMHMHGKYLLRTTLDDTEKNLWMFYNVIRTVEETFKTLKTDLDIRPVFHKSDEGSKAHLNLAVLAYWIVSVTKYRLRQKGVNVRWSEILRIMSSQVRITAEYDTADGHRIAVRRSSDAENTHETIYKALGIESMNLVTLKSVVHPQAPPKKTTSENQSDSDG